MMALSLLLQVALPAPSLPPPDWSLLPTLRYVRSPAESPALADFVRAEVRGGRCAAQRPTETGWAITVDIALLVSPAGAIRRSVPRAIDCPSVEQYAAGLVSSRARGNVATDTIATDTWYRTALTFAWAR